MRLILWNVLFIILSVQTGARTLPSESGNRLNHFQKTEEPDSLRILKQAISRMNQRIENLENMLNKQKHEEELKKLMGMAQNLSQQKKEERSAVTKVFRGGERQMQALNPNISLTGDFMGSLSSSKDRNIVEPGIRTEGRNRFALREAEFHIIAPLDPYTRGKFFLGIPAHGDDPLSAMIGEAYLEWLNLPGGINLKLGYFNTQFGLLNRWHDHGLPQADRPRALVHLFGLENFGGVGLSANILMRGLWAHVNELDIEAVSGGDGISFDEDPRNVITVLHFKNYYDLNRNTYLEIGFSGAHGFHRLGRLKNTILGADFTVKWTPAGESHYKTIEFRQEYFWSFCDTNHGTRKRFGSYAYLSAKSGRRFWLGIRTGYSELPFDRMCTEWDLTPYIDFWQSEFVMLRLQFSHTRRNWTDHDHSLFLQTVWSMGPHKHESY
ncbi:MAG TPA: hypothetical protein ENN03_04600 [bacterium]|nr:hypothetical protein [bacterium]